MGVEAETVFEQVQPKAMRFGWDRINTSLMRHMSNELKHTPDHYDPDRGLLVECVGLGRDGVLKFRTTKWHALRKWNNAIGSVGVFVWNSKQRAWAILTFEQMAKLVKYSRDTHGIQSFDVDGNTYFPIEWERITKMAGEVGGL